MTTACDHCLLLLEQDADVDAVSSDGDGWTALMAACHQRHADVVRVLLEAGADVDVADRADGSSALDLATRPRARDVVVGEALREEIAGLLETVGARRSHVAGEVAGQGVG